MRDGYMESILSESGGARYPDEFLSEYEALECLTPERTDITLLVKNKATNERFIAKCYTDKKHLSHVTEADILKNLNHPGLPRFADRFENDRMLCVVREYVRGTPLDRYAAKNTLSERQAVAFAVELCDILAYLHGQNPPVIHRDIKPQNLIVDETGGLHLIDFGISRTYSKDSEEDTVCFGTKDFAPPEQYGFAQTDARADIFSLGVLIGWMLTHNSERKNICKNIKNRYLRRVVKKSTAFAPDERYRSVEKVKRALLNADGHRQKTAVRLACVVLACAACLCAGFAIGRYTDAALPFSTDNVRFREPLIEQAVRLALNKDEDETITETDLLNVREIYIYGDKAVSDSAAFGELGTHMAKNDGVLKNGGLTSLEDLTGCKNLTTVCIVLEDITDVSPLAGLNSLNTVDLRHNPLEDVSPLGSLPALKLLNLFETHVSDLSSLSECKMLKNVDVGKTWITSFDALKGLTNVRELYMRETPLDSLSGIESLSYLEIVELSDVTDGDLSPLLALPTLREAILYDSLWDAGKATLQDAAFTVTYAS